MISDLQCFEMTLVTTRTGLMENIRPYVSEEIIAEGCGIYFLLFSEI
jgi:hypothetical protein